MPLIFSYGTLQLEHVQLSTFGRLLHGQPDELPGFEPSLVRIEDAQAAAASGKTHHTCATFNGKNDSRVTGVAVWTGRHSTARAPKPITKATTVIAPITETIRRDEARGDETAGSGTD